MKNYALGIDLGSASSKGILMESGTTVETFECPSGGDFKLTAEKMKEALLGKASLTLQDITRTVATGYGAQQVAFADEVKPEISCHGRGVFSLFPSVRTVIDVGDLYSRAFRIDDRGAVVHFVLSGKCAGGSARALTVIAKVLQIKVEEMGELSLKSTRKVEFNTGCAVFAESEAVSRIAEGVAKEDLLAGVHRALAAQINSLAERLGIEGDLAVVGGGARNPGLVKALQDLNPLEITVPPSPHMTAALGAAILAAGTVSP
ncbi:MAG: 2-hydroxyglutaryl-CoA dehydratase [Deltaproteobacteria bacterium]|nr:2-hydroxyglutaryl-CoA dehydratase [Deltaproteobacteria bacterium]